MLVNCLITSFQKETIMVNWGKRKDGQPYPKNNKKGILSSTSSTSPTSDVHMKEHITKESDEYLDRAIEGNIKNIKWHVDLMYDYIAKGKHTSQALSDINGIEHDLKLLRDRIYRKSLLDRKIKDNQIASSQ